jgi:hypothetical protein
MKKLLKTYGSSLTFLAQSPIRVNKDAHSASAAEKKIPRREE